MSQAHDFGEECDTLHALIATLDEADYDRPTAFKDWTTNDVLVHLHYWNRAADISPTDTEKLLEMVGGVMNAPTMRGYENDQVAERCPRLLALWYDFAKGMAERWGSLDPKQRVQWGRAGYVCALLYHGAADGALGPWSGGFRSVRRGAGEHGPHPQYRCSRRQHLRLDLQGARRRAAE